MHKQCFKQLAIYFAMPELFLSFTISEIRKQGPLGEVLTVLKKGKTIMRRSRGYDFRDIDGRFDNAGLALPDWQPSLWKRKQN